MIRTERSLSLVERELKAGFIRSDVILQDKHGSFREFQMKQLLLMKTSSQLETFLSMTGLCLSHELGWGESVLG